MWTENVKKVFSWFIATGLFLGVIFLLTYRYCELAGPKAEKACILAIITATLGGLSAFWPLSKVWRREPEKMVVSVFLGGAIRILIGFVGVVIIFFFTGISRKWFLGCYGIFYTVFLLVDSWLIIRLLNNYGLNKDDSKYECVWNDAREYQRTRRNCQQKMDYSNRTL